jgi:signal transduction histidine kinase
MFNLSLKGRITFGFLAFALLFVFMGFLVLRQQHQQSQAFEYIHYLERQVNQNRLIGQNLRDVQYQSRLFASEGHTSLIKKVKRLILKLGDQVSKAAINSKEKKLQEKLIKMKSTLPNFLYNFDNIVSEKQKREKLLNQDWPKAIDHIKKTWISVDKNGYEQYQIDLLFIENALRTYIQNLDAINIKKAIQSLDKLLKKTNEQPQLHTAIDSLRKLTINIAQTTRAYLYFVNVLMASDTAELQHESKALEKLSQQYIQKEQTKLVAAARQSSITIGIICALALIFTLVLSSIIAVSILKPLNQIRDTFNELSEGKNLADIPGIHKKDEIGDLARSANVFKEKNELTESLLSQAHEMTQNLQVSEAKLAKTNEELEQFVFTVSHDLKSPLVTAMGYIGMIQDMAKNGKWDMALAKLEKVVKANQRMSDLIRDLLDLSRVGRVDSDFEKQGVRSMLLEARENFVHLLKENEFDIEWPSSDIEIICNRTRTLQVFENIIGNALKYGKSPQGPNRIEISVEQIHPYTHVDIRDFGPGIPAEFHKKVFGLFSRLDSEQEGTGIGLAVVKKVMDFHKGEVKIINPEDGGTIFRLSFPIIAKT